MEEWKPVKGLEDRYAVSNQGRLKRTAPGKKTYPGKILNPARTSAGYPMVHLGYGRDRKAYYLHRLVAEAFLPPPDPEDTRRTYVAHRNGKPADNRADNLYWATPAENSNDQFLHGTARGHRQPNRTCVTDEQVKAIRQDFRASAVIAKDYGLGKGAVNTIRSRMTHRHVPPQKGDYEPVRNPRRFTAEDIRAIRSDTRPFSVIAREREVSANTIRDIVRRKFYAWVDDTDEPA